MKFKSLQDRLPLADGHSIPVVGLGLYLTEPGKESKLSIQQALKVGYRHFDTAALYQNEEDLGNVIRESGIPREEIFITTKLWNSDHGYENALNACDLSLKKLGMDYVDLYLIHWPVEHKRQDSWQALITLKKEGKAKSIGVSNYTINHLTELLENSDEIPVVNQVEFHPFLYQKALHEFCKMHKIQLEAYSPLTRGRKLNDPILQQIAKKHQKSPAQIMLRWCLQHEIIPLPKSVKPERIIENAEIFDFELSTQELAILDGLHQNYHIAWDPTNTP